MMIFIDESGKFVADDKVSVVCALSLPSKSVGPARRELAFASRSWPRHKGELKGGSLSADHLKELVKVLFRHDALLHCTATDVSAQERGALELHKQRQCEGITKHLTDEHNASLTASVWELRRRLEGMSLQLYVQCVVMLDLVYGVPQDCAHYFSQRRPRELAAFEWIIDAKEPLGPTPQEEWWRDVIGPILESRSEREPFGIVDDPTFDYSFLNRSFAFKKDQWRPDGPPRAIEGFDLKRMISGNVRFMDSRSDLLLQAVDILSSFMRRCLLGAITDREVIEALGRLQLMRGGQPVHLISLGEGDWGDRTVVERLKIMNAAARNMWKRKPKADE